MLVVSHDRYFLDNVCTKIWEVSFQTMTTYKGNFSAYLPQKEASDALRQKQHDADVALAEKLQDYVDRNLVRASTTKMAQSRRKLSSFSSCLRRLWAIWVVEARTRLRSM